MTALLEPTEAITKAMLEAGAKHIRLARESGCGEEEDAPLAAVIYTAMRSSAPQEPDDDALEQIAEFLVEQRNEPWPGGTDATRLHYWRDKAIEGARRLRALQAPETDYSGIDDG